MREYNSNLYLLNYNNKMQNLNLTFQIRLNLHRQVNILYLRLLFFNFRHILLDID